MECNISRVFGGKDAVWELRDQFVYHGLNDVVDVDLGGWGKLLSEVGYHGTTHGTEADEADGLEVGRHAETKKFLVLDIKISKR